MPFATLFPTLNIGNAIAGRRRHHIGPHREHHSECSGAMRCIRLLWRRLLRAVLRGGGPPGAVCAAVCGRRAGPVRHPGGHSFSIYKYAIKVG